MNRKKKKEEKKKRKRRKRRRKKEENRVSEEEEHYKALSHHASDCIKCGACETRCPFGVSIREKMNDAVKIFGY